jgi:hypothetical protein
MKMHMRLAWCSVLSLEASLFAASAWGQATAPKVLLQPQTSVQQDVPRQDAPLQDKPPPLVLDNTHVSWTTSLALSVRLNDASDLLAIIMTPSNLQKLLQYEDTQFGVSPSVEKLNHRRNALRTAIAQLKATSK